MRILFVSTNLPIPANNGSAMRSLSIIQALAASGHDLNFLSFAGKSHPAGLDPLSSYCRGLDLLEREMTNVSQHSEYLPRLKCLLSLKPYSIERFRCQAMCERIQKRLTVGRFDLIVCDSVYALVNIPDTDVPIVLNCHNIEHLIFERYSRIEKNVLKKYYATMESHLMRDVERRSCQRASVAMVCSQVDRDALQQLHPHLPIFVVPNAVDTDLILYDTSRQEDSRAVVLFQGGMDWYPNRDAVEFFARTILPLVGAECPHIKFLIAGRNPPPQLVAALTVNGRVEFTGTVPDMRPYLSAATVVVVPLRMGSGTRIKILEACAAGRSVVSTSVGAEGLDLESGKEIILADEPTEFARSVIALLQDADQRKALGRSARAAVVDRYSHVTLRRSLDTVVSSVAQAVN
jgi:polysaccharide biosynthesis protein PslH